MQSWNIKVYIYQSFFESLKELLCKMTTYETNIKIYSLERASRTTVTDFYFTLM